MTKQKRRVAPGQFPRVLKKDRSHNKLAQSLKKISKEPDARKVEEDKVITKIQKRIKKQSLDPSLVNKSYDTIMNDCTVLPQIDNKKPLRRGGKYKSLVATKPTNEELIKENEELRVRNKELIAKIQELEKVHAAPESKQNSAKLDPKQSKLIFEYERKISSLDLSLQSAQIKLQENDKLITQLLQTIDYLNQGAAKKGKKSGKPGEKQATPEVENGQFLFNKSELVQSHTQIKQTKYMIFEGFKSLQAEIIAKHGDHGKIVGIIDYLLGNLDSLFNIIHQLEIKELQYLNLLTYNQQNQPEHPSPKPHKWDAYKFYTLLRLCYVILFVSYHTYCDGQGFYIDVINYLYICCTACSFHFVVPLNAFTYIAQLLIPASTTTEVMAQKTTCQPNPAKSPMTSWPKEAPKLPQPSIMPTTVETAFFPFVRSSSVPYIVVVPFLPNQLHKRYKEELRFRQQWGQEVESGRTGRLQLRDSID